MKSNDMIKTNKGEKSKKKSQNTKIERVKKIN